MYYQIQTDATDKRWWDYSALVSTRNARSRLICVMGMAFFGQWYESLIPSFLRSSRYLASCDTSKPLDDRLTPLQVWQQHLVLLPSGNDEDRWN
jgi:hypothetical protein